MVIAVDFDGTLVEHKYPAIGDDIPYAFESVQFLQEKGHQLILWTRREGQELDEAVAHCRDRGVIFYEVNKNSPKEDCRRVGRKLYADLYIDDRNFGGLPDWRTVIRTLHPECFEDTDEYNARGVLGRYLDKIKMARNSKTQIPNIK